jgi:hypothetical protein
LVDDIENILQQHPEILDWAKVSLGIKDKNELIEYINKRAEEERKIRILQYSKKILANILGE